MTTLRRRPWLAGLLLALVLLSLVELLRVAQGLRQLAEARLLVQQVTALTALPLETLLQPSVIEGLHRSITRVEEDLGGARQALAPLPALASRLGWLPRYGPKLRSTEAMLRLMHQLARALRLEMEGARPLLEIAGQSPLRLLSVEEDAGHLLEALWGGQAAFSAALEAFNEAAQTHHELLLRDGHQAWPQELEVVSQILPLAQRLAAFGAGAPPLAEVLLGWKEPQTLLIISQNSQELRPTGGFMGGAWVVEMQRGQMRRLEFLDTSRLDPPKQDYPPPPPSLFESMWAGVWLFRDANWSPDFPTSASVALDLFERGQGRRPAVVLAASDTALPLLFQASGPLYLPQYGDWITSENAVERIQWYFDFGWKTVPALHAKEAGLTLPPHKLFMDDLLRTLLTEFGRGLDTPTSLRWFQALHQAFQERHLLLYFRDPSAQALVEFLGWDGRLRPSASDYLMVVDSNVGYSKGNPFIEQSVHYQVQLLPAGGADVTLSLRYRNSYPQFIGHCTQQDRFVKSYDEQMAGCYWDLLRLYTPEGSSLIDAALVPLERGSLIARFGGDSGRDSPQMGPIEKGKQVFQIFFALAPLQERVFTLRYRLPPSSFRPAEGWYQLLLQKQPGAPTYPVEVAILAPPGAAIVAASPAVPALPASSVAFHLAHSQDHLLELRTMPIRDSRQR